MSEAKTIRVKAVIRPDRAFPEFVDAETGQPIPVVSASINWDIKDKRVPTLTLTTYLRDLEYEGPATVHAICPKCKQEQKPQ